ncbi:MAG: hypothetical protein WDN04_06560 [Rhodospirillales bacterium]
MDPDQPRVRTAPLLARGPPPSQSEPHASPLERLLADFAWGRVDQVFAAALA